MLIGYKAPGQDDADWPALEIVATLLAGCPSARLYRRLVIEREAASSVDAQLTPFADPSLLRLAVTAARGHRADEILGVIDAEVAALVERPSAALAGEVAKAKALAETDFWTALVDVDGKAEALGHYETALGDFRKLGAIAERLASVTADDVARVIRGYLLPARRTIVIAEPEPDPEQDEPDPRRGSARGSGRRDMTTLIVDPSPDTPLVWFEIAIRGGASVDPRGVEGLHRHAALLARRGAGDRDRASLDATLDSLGAALDVGVSRDAVTLSGLALSRHLDALVDVAGDILAAPRFDDDEHARLLRETPQVLDEIRDDDGALATRWFDWVCSPGHA